MDQDTRQRLVELSADFYTTHADSFDQTRQSPWDSWLRLIEQSPVKPGNVLDLGCGNARFAIFLKEHIANFTYKGIDSEPRFIELGRQRFPEFQFEVTNLTNALAAPNDFDFIACFGVFHHIPGQGSRVDIINKIDAATKPGTVVAISFWQPKLLKNFETKVARDHNVDGLEHNDYLFGWQGDFSSLRYCHHFDDSEIDELIATTKLRMITQFQGVNNDATNRYVIVQNQTS